MEEWNPVSAFFKVQKYVCSVVADLILSYDIDRVNIFICKAMTLCKLVLYFKYLNYDLTGMWLIDYGILFYWYQDNKSLKNWNRKGFSHFLTQTLEAKDYCGKTILFYAVIEKDYSTLETLALEHITEFRTNQISLYNIFQQAVLQLDGSQSLTCRLES